MIKLAQELNHYHFDTMCTTEITKSLKTNLEVFYNSVKSLITPEFLSKINSKGK